MQHATPPLRLTDSELVSIIALTTPLPPHLRDQFLQELAAMLAGRELGPGAIHRAARELQRRFLTEPPEVPRHPSRWSSRRRNGVRAAADGCT
jgi:hypothetical protein